jgi:hypothetical protein
MIFITRQVPIMSWATILFSNCCSRKLSVNFICWTVVISFCCDVVLDWCLNVSYASGSYLTENTLSQLWNLFLQPMCVSACVCVCVCVCVCLTEYTICLTYSFLYFPFIHLQVQSVQQKSSGLKLRTFRFGGHVTYSCNHNLSRITFTIFLLSCRFSVSHSLQSITPRIY